MAAALRELRRLMQERGQLAAYIIPTDDAHQSEYIADCDKRREFISGFTGSAGLIIVTPSEALLWTDGRYHLQASKELDLTLWTLMRQGNEDVVNPEEWLGQAITKGQLIGYDPSLMAHNTIKKYSKGLEEGCGGILSPVQDNLVDLVWADNRPPPPNSDLIILDIKYAGRTWQEKVEDVREKMQTNKATVLLLTALDEVAWLFNLRGSDIDYNPVFFGYAIITPTDVRLYVSEVRTRLPSLLNSLEGVKLLPYSNVLQDLQDLIKESAGGSKIWISDSSAEVFVRCVSNDQHCGLQSPVQLLKGVKNATEISGMKACHVRDSAALCDYLCWLEEEVPKGNLNEVTAANKLDSLRKALPDYVSLSFPTISSSGPNGAVIHYRPDIKTARALCTSELYLCDSGGQYLDGTTDVTRTVAFGTPSSKEKEAFTLVLKGHIALCTTIFPDKTFGNQLDCLARAALWQQGLDYKHGTGHGVGAFLNVHEGPHGIGKSRPHLKPLQAGMFVTDEPGYYEDEAFGVRIENVELVKKVDTKYRFNDTDYLTMESVTLVPIQQKMIETSLLTNQEMKWLNAYHDKCNKIIGQYLLGEGKQGVAEWLEKETLPLKVYKN